MKKVLLLCAVLLAFAAPSAHAALNLAWNNCFGQAVGPPVAASNITLNCNGGGPYKLFGTFQSPLPIVNATALDITVDFNFAGASVPTFWQMATLACNETGLGLNVDRSAAATCGPDNLTPWGSTGSSATPLLTAYITGVGGANRARLLATIARSAISPTQILGTTNYYAFTLVFTTDNAIEGGGTCVGCPTALAVVWNKGIIFGLAGANASELTATELTSQDSGSNPCASANGGAGQCGATAAKANTWGAVKALYR